MPEYKCEKCNKCLFSKQALQRHVDRKKPCVVEEKKTKYQCPRCLICLSSKQRLSIHKSRINKCAINRHIPVVKTELVKQIEFEENKIKMQIEMKSEYTRELLIIFKKYDRNESICIKKRAELTKKFNINLKRLNERKTIPDKMFSVIKEKNKETDTVENMVKLYKIIKQRLDKAEKTIETLQDEQDECMIGMYSILNGIENDRTKLHSIKKQLRKQFDRQKVRLMTEEN